MISVNNNYFDNLDKPLVLKIASYLTPKEQDDFFLAQKRLYKVRIEDQQIRYRNNIKEGVEKTYKTLKVNGVADDVLRKIEQEIEIPPFSKLYEDRIGGLSKIITPLAFSLKNLPSKQLETSENTSKLSRIIMTRVFSLAGLLQKADQILMQQTNTPSEESKETIEDPKETISDQLQKVVEKVLEEGSDPQTAIGRTIADKIPDPKIKKTMQEKVNFIEESIYLKQQLQPMLFRGQFDEVEKIILEKVTDLAQQKKYLSDLETYRWSSAMVKAYEAGDLEEFRRLEKRIKLKNWVLSSKKSQNI